MTADPPTINPLACNPPEQACSDTPATSDPYGNGDDYMSYRKGSTSSPNPPPFVRGGRPVVNREGSTQYLSKKSIEGDGFYGGHPLRQTEVVGGSDGEGPDGGVAAMGGREGAERNRARGQRGKVDGHGHSAGHRGSSAQRHGRIRGEVTLDGDAADLER